MKAVSPVIKAKKSFKEREKKKPQSSDSNNHNNAEKGSPTKDSSNRLYAGIDTDTIQNCAEQSTVEHLSKDVSNTLTEDINYKIRYILNDALLKARLAGKTFITPQELELTFETLNIDKVYGAAKFPNWIPFDNQNLHFLEDRQVNLVDLAEEDNNFVQPGDPVITKTCYPELEISPAHRSYFTTTCQYVVDKDPELRRFALKNIGENPQIVSIVEWFYNLAFLLLSQDISRNCVTLYVLDLLTTLENSPNCRIHVSEKQLRLLVRLILQRLIKAKTKTEVLKPMCGVLGILCRRHPLKEFVINKIKEKLPEICNNYALPILTIVNFLGCDAIEEIFLPNMNLFLDLQQPHLEYTILALYNIICKENYNNSGIYNFFCDIFGDALVIYNQHYNEYKVPDREEKNFVAIKTNLIKTRRKISVNCKKNDLQIDDIFTMPMGNSSLKNKLDNFQRHLINKRETKIVVGKFSLLLPVLVIKKNKITPKFDNLLWYSF